MAAVSVISKHSIARSIQLSRRLALSVVYKNLTALATIALFINGRAIGFEVEALLS